MSHQQPLLHLQQGTGVYTLSHADCCGTKQGVVVNFMLQKRPHRQKAQEQSSVECCVHVPQPRPNMPNKPDAHRKRKKQLQRQQQQTKRPSTGTPLVPTRVTQQQKACSAYSTQTAQACSCSCCCNSSRLHSCMQDRDQAISEMALWRSHNPPPQSMVKSPP
jgi:hypothetical protein